MQGLILNLQQFNGLLIIMAIIALLFLSFTLCRSRLWQNDFTKVGVAITTS